MTWRNPMRMPRAHRRVAARMGRAGAPARAKITSGARNRLVQPTQYEANKKKRTRAKEGLTMGPKPGQVARIAPRREERTAILSAELCLNGQAARQREALQPFANGVLPLTFLVRPSAFRGSGLSASKRFTRSLKSSRLTGCALPLVNSRAILASATWPRHGIARRDDARMRRSRVES